MLFRIYQKLIRFYWRFFYRFLFTILLIVLILLTPIVYFLCPLEGSFDPLFSIFGIIGGLFSIGIALVGSLNIQYSLTKILIKYKYLQLLFVCIGLVILVYLKNFIVGFFYLYLGTGNLENVLGTWIICSLLFLFIHTFALIDKMFEPEELMIEVIAPNILAYENEKLSLRGEKILNLYDFILKDKLKIYYNEAFAFTLGINPEFENFGKVIYRLAKQHSFRLTYFISYLYSCPLKIKKRYLAKIGDNNNYRLFLMGILTYFITKLSTSNEEYDDVYSELLLNIFSFILSKDRNPNYKYGSLSDGQIIEMFIKLRNKGLILSLLESSYGKDLEAMHPDKDKQIFNFIKELIKGYIVNYNLLKDIKHRIAPKTFIQSLEKLIKKILEVNKLEATGKKEVKDLFDKFQILFSQA